MLKVVKGKTIEENIQSIDILISSLFERRYSLALDLIPEQVIQPVPVSVDVPIAAIGTKAFPLAGKITQLTCASLNLPKDAQINVTVINSNQSTTTKFSLPASKIQVTELEVPAGSEVEVELISEKVAITNPIAVGLVFVPDKLKVGV